MAGDFHVWCTLLVHALISKMQRKNRLKPSQLENKLQELREVPTTVLGLEQYQTPPHIAATLLWEISEHFDGIRDKVVLDLGCGSGVLSIGCLLLGAKFVVAVDVDGLSLEVAKCNAESVGFSAEQVLFVEQDVRCFDVQSMNIERFDTVVMNPPFGTRDQAGIDAVFVQRALESADLVYSMHKTSTRQFWLNKGVELGVQVSPLTAFKFNLEYSFKFHKFRSQDIDVDLLQFKRLPCVCPCKRSDFTSQNF